MTTKRGRVSLLSAVLALGSMIWIDGVAQTPRVEAQSTLEEVVVTARKRDEAFRDVPITMDVFTAERIQNAGIDRPQDFVKLTPNMTLIETQNIGNAFVVIRGISQARNSEPSVAVLVDNVLETNPAQFNQQLYDIESIEVLKGPQGALYGRNAIGGAIIVRTKQPGDEFTGWVKGSYDNGPGWRAQAAVGGPLGSTFKYQLAGSYYDTEGYIDNPFLGEDADPYREVDGRVRLLWQPNDQFTGELRYAISNVETQALYFNIVTDVNDTSLPVRVNNAGQNDRDMYSIALKLDYASDVGTFTSITNYDYLDEILTGDQFNFLPIPESLFFNILGFDLNQSQYLEVDSISQELRYTSPDTGSVRWIAGAYYIQTDRFISTGNMVDTGNGVYPVYRTPSTNPLNPQATFLADSQDNHAWAVYGDVVIQLGQQWELDLALRYDEDTREQTTLTPTQFLPNVPGFPQGFTGEVRSHTWDEPQPKVTLRYKPNEDTTLYGGYSRGFRSGGFNQTGVGPLAASLGILGVGDLFNEEVADTYEIGFKGQYMDGWLNTDASVFYTEADGSYFFVFIPNNSTQNLGNLDKVDYWGFEFELSARLADGFDMLLGYGYTDSEIKEAADPAAVGKQAPLVSEYTVNVGLQYKHAISSNSPLQLFARADYRRVGPTYWDPINSTVRDPIDIFDARLGLEGERWSAIAWSKNLNDEIYNAEFSPGGFVFKAKPRVYGIDLTWRF